MATLVAELGVPRIDAATLPTFELCLKRFTTAPTKAGILKVFCSTLRTLHQHCLPPATVYDRYVEMSRIVELHKVTVRATLGHLQARFKVD